ncbi:pilus assembly protein PilM [uncultured Desulfuromonas sp.]|uniref:pilus assembly protein PilM n=1 Tax=uncultured Desulfuromonas sp. TaxID=181013 RepID=UPI002AAA8BC9|nr:pilus assembly protein PilM [uncultured Desulfuromonas sp.]
MHLVQEEPHPKLVFAECAYCSADQISEVLHKLVEKHGLSHSRTVAVMARGSYNLIQIDPPDVPENEFREAVRWQIKDLLDFPADQAVVDTFSSKASENQTLSFAVAASQEQVWHVVHALRDAELDTGAIDIPELAQRSLVSLLPDDGRGLALLSLWKDSGLITIVRNGELCMARRINLGVQELVAAADPANEIDGVEISQAQQNILDAVILEIQRSLDYYESSVSRQPVSSVYIAPLSDPVPGLQSYLDSYLAPEIKPLQMGDLLADCTMSDTELCHCLSAIGAALRTEWS